MIRRRLWIRLAATAPLPVFTMPSAIADTPVPAEVRNALPQARLQGTGVLRFFGLRVYEARLWTAPGFVADDYAREPFALELIYDRRLEGQAIAERSVAEMRRVGAFDDARARQWLALMLKAFPDVAATDRLLGLHDGQGDVSFFHNGKLTAQVVDAEYARLFFGIWLARQSSAPALREALLGLAR
ncbi:chalcone isomerase family protein [Roseateles sp.]|uniref:chalcone isomerase family protein n=1 Tax=Roseateles sp. TaxID=1971397 RepID=UPI0039E95CBC